MKSLPQKTSLSRARRDNLSRTKKQLATLTNSIEKQLNSCASKSVDLLREYIKCGELLLEAKLLVGHGQWETFIADNFSATTGLSERTAQNYMRLARRYREFRQRQRVAISTESEPVKVSDDGLLRQFRLEVKPPVDGFSGDEGSTALPKRPARRTIVLPFKTCHSNDWLSPAAWIAAAAEVFGGPIISDPCALSMINAPDIAVSNITLEMDGLAEMTEWQDNAFVNPGQSADPRPWFDKTITELNAGRIEAAVLCVGEAVSELPSEMLRYPIAITTGPATVTLFDHDEPTQFVLPCRMLFVFIARQPDVAKFAHAFGSVGAVFAPVDPQ